MNSRKGKTRKDANLPREGNPTPHPPLLRPVSSPCLVGAPVLLSTVDFSPLSAPPQLQGQPTPWGSSTPSPRPAPGGNYREQGTGLEGSRQSPNSLLPPLLLPNFKSSPVLLPKAVPLEEPPPEPLTGHASARAGDLGLDCGLPPGLASSDLGEGETGWGPGRSLPRGGAFTHMVRAWTPAQASRPNLTTGSVILL